MIIHITATFKARRPQYQTHVIMPNCLTYLAALADNLIFYMRIALRIKPSHNILAS